MTLRQWAENGWIRSHKTSPNEIRGLISVVNRNLLDANQPLSPDWRFNIAYDAALKLFTILLYSEGYRAGHEGAYYRTIAAMPLIMGDSRKRDAEYLDRCRSKRNIATYEYADAITESEAVELLDFVQSFKQEVLSWLETNHKELLNAGS
jgi:hypothetical protein